MVDSRRPARTDQDHHRPDEYARAAEEQAAAAMLGQLQQMLASAGASEDVLGMLDGSHDSDTVLRELAGARPGNAAAEPARPARGSTRTSVHCVKVTLRGGRPPIWRRLEVPSSTPLDRLHGYLQVAFGWRGANRWVFRTPHGDFGESPPESGLRSAAATRLRQVAPGGGDRLGYTYHAGGDWQHDIVVEEVSEAQPGVAYPRCLAGRRTAPPDGWLHLRSLDRSDPSRFSIDEVNAGLPSRVLIRA